MNWLIIFEALNIIEKSVLIQSDPTVDDESVCCHKKELVLPVQVSLYGQVGAAQRPHQSLSQTALLL